MQYSQEQLHAFNKYIDGENVFITGPGGSGKTELIRAIYERSTREKENIQVCALTGCAALLLRCQAKTIHSWGGIGLGNGNIDTILSKIKANPYKLRAWLEIKTLVIDEVSMMSLKIFELLDVIGRNLRNRLDAPFGGIQVIFSGDFYQLPPVGTLGDMDTFRFCFESETWNECFPRSRSCQIHLVKIFRQTDQVYSTMLTQIREGKIKRRSLDLLMTYVGREKPVDMVIPQLYPVRHKVIQINHRKMSELPGEEHSFCIKKQSYNVPPHFSNERVENELQHMESTVMCEPVLKLKQGAHVMCVVNISIDDDHAICNGSQGVVSSFSFTGLPVVKFNNGVEITMNYHTWESEHISGVGISQIPLILAWAITIHKSQGSTMDCAEIDVGSGIFECGQTYVALSRVKSLDGLYLTSFDVSRIKINKKVQQFYSKY
jgi:ATP-dependent DNA helicase PIF1